MLYSTSIATLLYKYNDQLNPNILPHVYIANTSSWWNNVARNINKKGEYSIWAKERNIIGDRIYEREEDKTDRQIGRQNREKLCVD